MGWRTAGPLWACRSDSRSALFPNRRSSNKLYGVPRQELVEVLEHGSRVAPRISGWSIKVCRRQAQERPAPLAPPSPPVDIHANRALVVRSLPMSERLVIPGRAEAESELSVAHSWWQFSVRFNVAVSHSVPVMRMHERETEGVMMRWGLVPSSAKGDVTRGGHAHARSDALQSAQDFRSGWFHGQRGIVPLAGFYAGSVRLPDTANRTTCA